MGGIERSVGGCVIFIDGGGVSLYQGRKGRQ